MKNFLLLPLLILSFLKVEAQHCLPDPEVPDTVILFPLPYDPALSPDGGITDTAYLGDPFGFTFTFNVPETFIVNGL